MKGMTERFPIYGVEFHNPPNFQSNYDTLPYQKNLGRGGFP